MCSRAVPTFNVGILKAALALNGGCLYFKEQNAIGGSRGAAKEPLWAAHQRREPKFLDCARRYRLAIHVPLAAAVKPRLLSQRTLWFTDRRLAHAHGLPTDSSAIFTP